MRIILSIVLWLFMAAGLAQADQPKRYASIVVDADTLEIIHARQIDELRFPASLTKVMTLYLVFDALNSGELTLDETLIVSPNAARTPPVGLGLTSGQAITVDQAIQAVAVRSANDAAVVLAERLAGSEELFALQMTRKAQELGMLKTTFKTANGLPHPDQKTTARDMAKLATATLNHHRRHYHYFGQRNFKWRGRHFKNTNSLLHWLNGVDGFKTGFTNDSGYNLIISAQRDGRRIIAVVLGGASGHSRDTHMRDLIERGFKTLGVKPVISRPPVTVKKKAPQTKEPAMAAALRLRKSDGKLVTVLRRTEDVQLPDYNAKWSAQLGAFSNMDQADSYLNKILSSGMVNPSRTEKSIQSINREGIILHRARLTGFSAVEVQDFCKKISNLSQSCLVIAPGK